jgi:hypothetical protein
MWIGWSAGLILVVIEFLEGIGLAKVDSSTEHKEIVQGLAQMLSLEMSGLLFYVCGLIYWFYCVYRIHKVLAVVTNSTYPISPRRAVGYYFIPFYNLVWMFKWTNQIATFVNSRSTSVRVTKWWPGVGLLLALVVGLREPGLYLLILFGVGAYLTRRIDRVVPSGNARYRIGRAGQHLCRTASVGLTVGFLLCNGIWDFANKSHLAQLIEVFAIGVVTFLVLWFIDPVVDRVVEWFRSLRGRTKEHDSREDGSLVAGWVFLLCAFFANVAHGVVHDQIVDHAFVTTQVLIGGLFAAGIVTYSWVVAKRHSPLRVLEYGLLTGLLVGLFFTAALGVKATNASSEPNQSTSPTEPSAAGWWAQVGAKATAAKEKTTAAVGEAIQDGELKWKSGQVAWIFVWALLGLAGGLAIWKGFGPRGVLLGIVTAAFACGLVLGKENILDKSDVILGLWSVLGWCIGLIVSSGSETLLGRSRAATMEILPPPGAQSSIRVDDSDSQMSANVPLWRRGSWQAACCLVLFLFFLPITWKYRRPPGEPGVGHILTAIASDVIRPYGTPDPPLRYTFKELAKGDDEAKAVSGAPLLSSGATLESPPGSYPIKVAQGMLASNKYSLHFEEGTLVVIPAACIVTLSPSHPAAVKQGAPVTFEATVAPAAQGTPTGTVKFLDGMEVLGTSDLADGPAIYTTSSLPPGPHLIKARYTGDTNFSDATSPTVIQEIEEVPDGRQKEVQDHTQPHDPDVNGHRDQPVLGDLDVLIAAGTPLTVRTIDAIDSSTSRKGQMIAATLEAPIVVNGRIVAPAGSAVALRLADVDRAGHYAGRPSVTLQLVRLTIGGHSYQLSSNPIQQQGASRGADTAKKTGIGAAVGGALGGIFGRGKGAAAGAASGAGAAAGVQAFTKAAPVRVPSEMVLVFRLQSPLTVRVLQNAPLSTARGAQHR